MFLKYLHVHNEDVLIREVYFHSGVNLIIDETKSSEKKTSSGNSVGKTTVLRLIDFCLDGSGKNIYVDPEFKTKNKVVEEFLKNNNIIVTLKLVEDLNDEASAEVIIERNFLDRSKKIQRINGEDCTSEKFTAELKSLIFKTDSDKPTLKQLKSKNIRDEKDKLVNTIRVLHPMTTDVTYETLHLFWFGVDIDLSKDKLVREKNLEDKLQTRLRQESNLSQVKQSLIIVDKQIASLQTKKSAFSLNESYDQELRELNEIKLSLNSISGELSHLELRRDLIMQSKADLEKNVSEIETEQIKKMYVKAKTFMPNIQKTFEETLAFHNDMIQKKIHFIAEELPHLEQKIRVEKHRMQLLLHKENTLSRSLKKSGAVDDLQSIINDLNYFYEKKGHLEEKKRLWEKSISNLERINSQLSAISDEIKLKDDLIQTRIAEFNGFFSDISSRLDGVHSVLSADNEGGCYKFVIDTIESNPGTGSKKSQMASFDLAYIKFADTYEIPCLHFVLQDQIENVHSNQINNLFTEIVSEVNCQYVLPVLRDKLPAEIDVEELEALSLSQESRFFKI